MIFAVVLSLIAGVALYFGVTMAAYRILDSVMMQPDMIARRELECADRLQQYITQRNIGLLNINRLDEWAETEPNVLFTVYQGADVIYYNLDVIVGLPDKDGVLADDSSILQDTVPDTGSQEHIINAEEAAGYDIRFRDGTAHVVLICFVDNRYYLMADLIGGMLGIGVALMILYEVIRRKVRYITLLESELQILKGGDLTYPVTIKGKDELAGLAAEIDSMRRSIRERQQEEEQAVRANRELVTAMSHDLRTPLTSLLGYVDILKLHKYQEGQQEQYIHAIGEKAYQIKSMSDKLFEYFLVFRKEREELQLEQVNGMEFLGQVVEESLFDLESEGFLIARRSDPIDCVLHVDVELIRRVFGNIFSNLLKYADRSQPVQVCYEQREDRLTVCFRNFIMAGEDGKESSQIGLKTCEKIMEEHGGSFHCRKEKGRFEVWVEFNTERERLWETNWNCSMNLRR